MWPTCRGHWGPLLGPPQVLEPSRKSTKQLWKKRVYCKLELGELPAAAKSADLEESRWRPVLFGLQRDAHQSRHSVLSTLSWQLWQCHDYNAWQLHQKLLLWEAIHPLKSHKALDIMDTIYLFWIHTTSVIITQYFVNWYTTYHTRDTIKRDWYLPPLLLVFCSFYQRGRYCSATLACAGDHSISGWEPLLFIHYSFGSSGAGLQDGWLENHHLWVLLRENIFWSLDLN